MCQFAQEPGIIGDHQHRDVYYAIAVYLPAACWRPCFTVVHQDKRRKSRQCPKSWLTGPPFKATRRIMKGSNASGRTSFAAAPLPLAPFGVRRAIAKIGGFGKAAVYAEGGFTLDSAPDKVLSMWPASFNGELVFQAIPTSPMLRRRSRAYWQAAGGHMPF